MRLLDVLWPARSEKRATLNLSGYFELLQQALTDGTLLAPTTMPGVAEESVAENFAGYVRGLYARNGVVFACMAVRQLVFQEATLKWRAYGQSSRPGRTFGTPDLELVERPYPGGTTMDLLGRAINDADLAGNAYLARRSYRTRDSLKRLRPDWVTVVMGTPNDTGPDEIDDDLDLEIVGYLYHPGGRMGTATPVALQADRVAKWSPMPDPTTRFLGMSPLTPLVREIGLDNQATTYKTNFFKNSATPNMVVKLDISDPERFKEWIEIFESKHKGADQAFKTLYLGAGADSTVVGSNFKDMDLRALSGLSETRIAAALGTHPVIVGLSEGMGGSALNAGNYGSTRRRFADGTIRPLWRHFCGTLGPILDEPADAHLWYDSSDIPFLQEDEQDAANIRQADASAMRQLVDGGFDPDSVVDAVTSNDMTLLSHTGKLSVQLQPPGVAAG